MALTPSFLRSLLPAKVKNDDEECAPLLDGGQSPSAATDGSPAKPNFVAVDKGEVIDNGNQQVGGASGQLKQEQSTKMESLGWIPYLRRFAIVFPTIWPANNRKLQLHILGSIACEFATRVFKIIAPVQLGTLIKALGNRSGHLPLYELVMYLVFDLIEEIEIFDTIKVLLWTPVEQNARKSGSLLAYNHVMKMSGDFHDNVLLADLYTAIDQGTSLYTLLDTILFTVAPMVIDLLVACAYLTIVFGIQMSAVVFTTTITYLYLCTYFTKKQTEVLRVRLEAHRQENRVVYDSIACWLTVAYFNNFRYELNRYSEAIDEVLKLTRKSDLWDKASSNANRLVMNVGYAGALFIAAYRVSHGTLDVSKFVVLLSYWHRFTGPLLSFGWIQQNVQENFVEAEKMLEVLLTPQTVKDGPSEIKLSGGAIEFKDVHFSYDGKKSIISDFNFSASSGQKIALVGETGSGKSTILKLLFRFYDISAGSVKIDNQDVRDVTIESLRQAMGVVPQDPTLFNDTVINNVRYSRQDATDEEVMDSCRAAAVHDQILSFTDGYETKVGENGVKLSGGEIQRIAIARAILKDPKILLLDEATSAVDSQTEANIQAALRKLTKGRTTFVIAHRLSTVMDADIMLVIKDGCIVEQGVPRELLKDKDGKFFHLWSLQTEMATEISESMAADVA